VKIKKRILSGHKERRKKKKNKFFQFFPFSAALKLKELLFNKKGFPSDFQGPSKTAPDISKRNKRDAFPTFTPYLRVIRFQGVLCRKEKINFFPSKYGC